MSACAKAPDQSLIRIAARLLKGFSAKELEALLYDWLWQGRAEQLPPMGDWRTWLFLGGRGAGKTRAGAEWVRALANGLAPFAPEPLGRIALIGETLSDVREVMIDGVSGLLSCHPKAERPMFHKTRMVLEWPNGAIAQGFSADDPDSLRGPQFHAAWCDELAKWRYGVEAYAMLQFALRLGARPQAMVTTTPRPVPLLKKLLGAADSQVSHAQSHANFAFLAPGFLKALERDYGGTRLGRQELMGELVEERDDALFTRADIERNRVVKSPELTRIVVAVDPPVTAHKGSDACGLIVAGVGVDERFYVLQDGTLQGKSPSAWARAALRLYHAHKADRLVVEVNQGGDLVKAVMAQEDASVPVTAVRATRGKFLRAEPIASLYEQGRVAHVGGFAKLEDEMCDFGLDGLSSGRSPDRLDALVWALTALLEGGGSPRVRAV